MPLGQRHQGCRKGGGNDRRHNTSTNHGRTCRTCGHDSGAGNNNDGGAQGGGGDAETYFCEPTADAPEAAVGAQGTGEGGEEWGGAGGREDGRQIRQRVERLRKHTPGTLHDLKKVFKV